MKKYFLGILTFLSITLFASISNAGVGVSLIIGEAETSGTETEKTVTGVTSEKNSITINEAFYGGSIFAELAGVNLVDVILDQIHGEDNDYKAKEITVTRFWDEIIL